MSLPVAVSGRNPDILHRHKQEPIIIDGTGTNGKRLVVQFRLPPQKPLQPILELHRVCSKARENFFTASYTYLGLVAHVAQNNPNLLGPLAYTSTLHKAAYQAAVRVGMALMGFPPIFRAKSPSPN